jgi:glyoxylase-like metal-dependent hydrolase (beta-lactamase superfamily II)
VSSSYTEGLVEVADGVAAYLQPDGGWGWSNAGLVTGEGASLLVDTLFDLRLTARMLAAMAPRTARAPIATVLNTHANGDHCYGNELVAAPGVEIIASAAAAREMDETPPAMLAGLVALADQLDEPLGAFVRRAFGPFDFEGITAVAPTRTFSGASAVAVGSRVVELFEVGPAHTAGDVIAWVADARVVFAGDILFIEGTPILWAGPVANWLAACERILALDAAVIVPGHGPLTDAEGVRALAAYLAWVEAGVRERRGAMDASAITHELFAELGATPFSDWGDPERLVINVETILSHLVAGYARPTIPELFARMAALG